MPAHAKTTDEQIVRATRKLLEAHGENGFSMADVAKAVGVRAPSLYGRFADREALLDAVELALWLEFGRKLDQAKIAENPIASLTAQAHAYRALARANPEGYGLLFRANAERSAAGLDARSAAVSTTLPALIALSSKRDALAAARVIVPFLHGFVAMELAGAFRLGGGLDDAFALGVATILKGISRKSIRTRS